MLLDRSLYQRTLTHLLNVINDTHQEENPFPHILLKGVFPKDIYQLLLDNYPSSEFFTSANPKHHSNLYGVSTRYRLSLTEPTLNVLPIKEKTVWTTIRAAIGSAEIREALFAKLASGLCRRFGVRQNKLSAIRAFPRSQLYSECQGFRIAPHPDTREKIVTMQFAFPADDSLRDVGTEFYQRSLNPFDLLREPRGFKIVKSMPFLPNHAYAFSVLNDFGIKSWHGRSTISPMNLSRDSLLHIWYAEPDESHQELIKYQDFLNTRMKLRKCA